jgi:hypothetical protein
MDSPTVAQRGWQGLLVMASQELPHSLGCLCAETATGPSSLVRLCAELFVAWSVL